MPWFTETAWEMWTAWGLGGTGGRGREACRAGNGGALVCRRAGVQPADWGSGKMGRVEEVLSRGLSPQCRNDPLRTGIGDAGQVALPVWAGSPVSEV